MAKSMPLLSLAGVFLLAGIIAFSGGKMESSTAATAAASTITGAALEKLAGRTIYFGHQSVGFDIVEGIEKLLPQYPGRGLEIVESDDPAAWRSGQFIHSRVGKNKDPRSKMEGFARLMTSEGGRKVDIAALKFCYVDIRRNTDVEAVLAEYAETVTRIREANPELTLLHFTVPLRTTGITWKAWIKRKILRRDDVWEYNELEDNIIRNRYNRLLRERYGKREPLFDVAEAESTAPDGSRAAFSWEGERYYALAPEYSSDGGHLNESGSMAVGRKLLTRLAALD